jgi:hypothetical protein
MQQQQQHQLQAHAVTHNGTVAYSGALTTTCAFPRYTFKTFK